VYTFWKAWTVEAGAPQRYGWLALSGLLYGCGLLIRPILLGLWALWVVFWLATRRQAREGNKPDRSNWLSFLEMAAFLSMLLAIVIPWELKAFQHTGELVPISTAGPTSIRDGLTFGIRLKNYRQDQNLPAGLETVMAEIDSLELSEINPDRLSAIFSRHPLAFSKLLLLKTLRSWYATDSARYENLILPIQLVYLGLILWGLIAAWRSRGRPRLYASFVVLTSLYFWLATTSALSILRYMIPAMCLLMTIIPAGIFQFPLLKKFAKG
jgi:hypothetical protein